MALDQKQEDDEAHKLQQLLQMGAGSKVFDVIYEAMKRRLKEDVVQAVGVQYSDLRGQG